MYIHKRYQIILPQLFASARRSKDIITMSRKMMIRHFSLFSTPPLPIYIVRYSFLNEHVLLLPCASTLFGKIQNSFRYNNKRNVLHYVCVCVCKEYRDNFAHVMRYINKRRKKNNFYIKKYINPIGNPFGISSFICVY